MLLAGLTGSLDRISQIQAHLPALVSVIMAIVGVGAVVIPGLLHIAQPIETIAHEGAHAVVGSAIGRKIKRMEFNFSGEGETHHDAETSLIRFPITLSGYLGPSAFGLGGAELIRSGHIVAVPWIGLVGLLPVLYLARKSLGVILVIGVFVALLLVLAGGSEGLQVTTAYAITWFLLISGVRSVLKHGKDAGDAQTLRSLTGLPPGFWPPIWFIGTTAALIFGATQLL